METHNITNNKISNSNNLDTVNIDLNNFNNLNNLNISNNLTIDSERKTKTDSKMDTTNINLNNTTTKDRNKNIGIHHLILKFLKPYELAFLLINLIVVIIIFIFTTDKNLLSFSCSFVSCFAILFLAKGFYFAPIFNIIYDILYIILSYTQNYFGEAIIYILMTLPIDIYSSIAWRKNKTNNSNVIKINKLSKKEWLCFWLGMMCLAVVSYFILGALNTSELLISTISLVTTIAASYLLIRRNNYYSLAYSLNDFVLIILWIMSFIKFGASYLPMVINFCCNFLIEMYGFINLQRELKLQKFQ